MFALVKSSCRKGGLRHTGKSFPSSPSRWAQAASLSNKALHQGTKFREAISHTFPLSVPVILSVDRSTTFHRGFCLTTDTKDGKILGRDLSARSDNWVIVSVGCSWHCQVGDVFGKQFCCASIILCPIHRRSGEHFEQCTVEPGVPASLIRIRSEIVSFVNEEIFNT